MTQPIFDVDDLIPHESEHEYQERMTITGAAYEAMIEREHQAHMDAIVKQCAADTPQIEFVRTVMNRNGGFLRVIDGGVRG